MALMETQAEIPFLGPNDEMNPVITPLWQIKFLISGLLKVKKS